MVDISEIHENGKSAFSETCSSINQTLTRQNSYKRPSSTDERQDAASNFLNKRVCTAEYGNFVTCALARFGCLDQISSHDMREHYLSKIHQESILRAATANLSKLNEEMIVSNTVVNSNEDQNSEHIQCLNMLSEGILSLHDDHVRIQSESTKLNCAILQCQTEIEEVKQTSKLVAPFCQATQLNIDVMQAEIENLRQKVNELEFQSAKNGTFVWKITDLAQKIDDAVSDRVPSIYSPPFFSSPSGYKMCMRLYLNGDGQARRTHVSLFFVLMRGDYDAILTWPFPFKVTFCLFDQSENKRHIIDSFRPDTKSNSFQRPVSFMNVASGLPKFCPIAAVHSNNSPYVSDDCIFIRCIVDFESTPKSMIPYICKIDLGLPLEVQQAMIQAERERRQTLTELTSNSTDTGLTATIASNDENIKQSL